MKYKDGVNAILQQYQKGFDQYQVQAKEVTKRVVKMLYIFYEVQRKDLYFTGANAVKICLHFVMHLPSDYSCYKCYSTFLIESASFMLTKSSSKANGGMDESQIFNTMVQDTLYSKVIKAKSIEDADIQFIIDKLKSSEFKSWGDRVSSKLAKLNIKLKDYINELKSSFLMSELPLEFTTIIIDQFIVEGSYALIRAIITFLHLKWGYAGNIETSDISVTLFFKAYLSHTLAIGKLNLKKEEITNEYYSKKQEYKGKLHHLLTPTIGKIDLKNILLNGINN